jgi:hypothetical protein
VEEKQEAPIKKGKGNKLSLKRKEETHVKRFEDSVIRN